MSVSLKNGIMLREMGIRTRESIRAGGLRADRDRARPVTVESFDYRSGQVVDRHGHGVCQLIYAVQGVMVVATSAGQWIVPATRAVWVPARIEHSIRMVGRVRMRTAYVHPTAAPGLPEHCGVVAVSPLLKELLLAAAGIRPPYARNSRESRLTRVLLDELIELSSLPLGLPYPRDPRLRIIHETLVNRPDDRTTLAGWAGHIAVDPKTVHRLFLKETGMTFQQWRQQARLLAALEHLARGERVLDVAAMVGYDSPTAFSTMFRRALGKTPHEYFAAPPSGGTTTG